jgi:hypothetical protein
MANIWHDISVPRIDFLKDILTGLVAYIYYKDHGFPHLVVRKGSGKRVEAEMKIRIDNFDVLEVHGFSKASANKIVKSLEPYRAQLMEVWNETQSK